MSKLTELFLGNQRKSYKQLVPENKKAIDEYNEKMISILPLMGWLLMLLPLLAVPFSNTKAEAITSYLFIFAIFFILFILFRFSVMKKYSLYGLYITFSALFMFAIYLSVIHSPNMRATILLGAFCIMPLSFIDRPRRMNLFVAFWFAVHTVLAFNLKQQYALDDTINCLVFSILGCFLGNMVVHVRLESYDMQRLLTIEKDTDVLTGLFNRRKLFETLAYLETEESEKPSGIFMMDIDHFKEFNDSYGHAAGDDCLGNFGGILTKFAQNFRLHFYRYGGEEFLALAYGYGEDELSSIAESLRIAVQSADIAGHHITISIGVAYCGEEKVRNYEKVISRADEATYAAKRSGRNKVCMAQNEVKIK